MTKLWLPMVAALLISLAPFATSPALAVNGDGGGDGGSCCYDGGGKGATCCTGELIWTSETETKDALPAQWVANHPERFDRENILVRRTTKDFSDEYRRANPDRFTKNGLYLEDPDFFHTHAETLPDRFVNAHPAFFNPDGYYIGDYHLLSTKEAMDPDFVTLHPEQFDAEGRYIGEPPPFFSLPSSCCTVPRALTAGAEWGLATAALTVLLLGLYLTFRHGAVSSLWHALVRRQ